jgi:hypothetical protein
MPGDFQPIHQACLYIFRLNQSYPLKNGFMRITGCQHTQNMFNRIKMLHILRGLKDFNTNYFR